MTLIQTQYIKTVRWLETADWALSTLARLIFAGVLLIYYFNSGLTKLGDGPLGIFHPSLGAYAQIFPTTIEALGYDLSGISPLHRVIVVLGTVAEFVLPILIVIGLFTRFAAVGMIGFIFVQSITDVYGHGLSTEVGGWFDRFPDALILDQRAMWVFLLIVLIIKGAGPLSLDRFLLKNRGTDIG